LPITYDNWPSFLYPEDKYDADALNEHLLQGTFLLSVHPYQWFIYMLILFLMFLTSLHLTTNWYKDYTRKGAQKKCLTDLYDMTEVYLGMIAYVAVLVHLLNLSSDLNFPRTLISSVNMS
jgi:hypothetical protein